MLQPIHCTALAIGAILAYTHSLRSTALAIGAILAYTHSLRSTALAILAYSAALCKHKYTVHSHVHECMYILYTFVCSCKISSRFPIN